MRPIRFGLIGAGWRAQFYSRIASSLPERFQLAGVAVRDEQKRRAIERSWNVKGYETAEELIEAANPDFIVSAVSKSAATDMLLRLAGLGVPLLAETPPATDRAGISALRDKIGPQARIQIAEQYPFQPLHAARLEAIRLGLLGEITQAQVSAAHGYHGIGLIRAYLDIPAGGRMEVSITATRFISPIVEGPNRDRMPAEARLTDSVQDMAWLQFGEGKLGVFDFARDQYFSWIRGERILIRGEKGEIAGNSLRYLADYDTPIETDCKRMSAGAGGNLEGHYLKGIIAGERWLYRNPFPPARLSDEEIAIAACLEKMGEYARNGVGFYSLQEALLDVYLACQIEEAIRTGRTVQAVWEG